MGLWWGSALAGLALAGWLAQGKDGQTRDRIAFRNITRWLLRRLQSALRVARSIAPRALWPPSDRP